MSDNLPVQKASNPNIRYLWEELAPDNVYQHVEGTNFSSAFRHLLQIFREGQKTQAGFIILARTDDANFLTRLCSYDTSPVQIQKQMNAAAQIHGYQDCRILMALDLKQCLVNQLSTYGFSTRHLNLGAHDILKLTENPVDFISERITNPTIHEIFDLVEQYNHTRQWEPLQIEHTPMKLIPVS